MAEHEGVQDPSLTPDEAAEVIRDATRIQQGRGEALRRSDVLAIAKELGLSEEAVDQALARRAAREKARLGMRGRWFALISHVTSYAGTVGGLAAIDYLSGGGWWVQWVAIPWGIALAMHAVHTVLGLDSEGDKEAPR